MIPNNITKENVLQAINDIDKNGLRYPLGKSYVHDLLYKGKTYPPKHTIIIANEFANGQLLGHKELTTLMAQRFLAKLDDEFKIQSKTNDPIRDLLEKYKQNLIEKKLEDEVYKWELLGKYKGRPNIDAIDFGKEISTIDYRNLIYHNGIAVRNHISREKPEEYRAAFRILFNEEIDLKERIERFQESVLAVYRSMGEILHHHHDERSIATFLAFHNPDKYALYKSSFYEKYCKLINLKPKQKGEKYVDYLHLLETFIADYIQPDEELLELINDLIPADAYHDDKHNVLAQDILYKMLDRKDTPFKEVIEDLKLSMAEDESVLNLFSFGKLQDNGINAKKDTFVWIKDASKTIGNLSAHYEISIRSRGKSKDFYFVEIHFEDTDKKKFYDSKIALPENAEWIDWQSSKSIAFKEGLNPKDDDLVEKLKEQLLYLELNLGDQIRSIMKSESVANENDGKHFDVNKIHHLNQILFGPPGTGKTFNTINKALEIIWEKEEKELDFSDRNAVKALFDQRLKEGRIIFTTFHQSMSYEDFIEGIKPRTTGDNQVIYETEDGIFKKICTKAEEKEIKANNFEDTYKLLLKEIDNTPGHKLVLETLIQSKEFTIYKNSRDNIRFHANTDKAYEGVIKKEVLAHYLKTGVPWDWPSYVKALGNYLKEKYKYTQAEEFVSRNFVLIIDEINRGNVSQIFGELITLIEDDKRIGCDEELRIQLPYSKKEFGVPPNLYIIGTMNTADRSVEALDTALRRRFYFEEIVPNSQLIKSQGKLKVLNGVIDDIDLSALLNCINKRIEILLDKDHLIGHSFFMQVKNLKDLKESFQNKIMPLLQEYFYGDFGKIGLILGKGFVKEKTYDNIDAEFASFPYETSLFDEKKVYQLNDYTAKDSYEIVLEKEIETVDFKRALQILMR